MKRWRKILLLVRKSWFFDLWWIAFPPYLEENEEIIFCNNCATYRSSFEISEYFESCVCTAIHFKVNDREIIVKEKSNMYRIRK